MRAPRLFAEALRSWAALALAAIYTDVTRAQHQFIVIFYFGRAHMDGAALGALMAALSVCPKEETGVPPA